MSRKNISGVSRPAARVKGGVPVAHNKNTADMPVERMPAPESVIIPVLQHVGAPCVPVVNAGDKVAVGQLIADSDKYISAPIHASISGTVKKIGETVLPHGVIVPSITIESDGQMKLFDGLEPPKVNNKEDFIKAVRASGLVGLGGAGFPTHAKLNYPPEKNVDTLIVNVAECEPYITVDYREVLENSWDILSGIFTVKEFLGIKNVIISVENNKPEAIAELKKISDSNSNSDGSIKVMALKSRYPQGAEKMIILAATGRKVPPGKLPADIGCLVMNVASVAFLARYLKSGKPLVSRTLTVDGSAVVNPKNVRVPLGTNVGEIFDYCGGFKTEPYKIITGGPMMGHAVIGTDIPVIKHNNALLAFDEKAYKIKKERDCIRCGRCTTACPVGLMPALIARFANANEADKLEHTGVTVCMECGACAYACPSGIPLVQYMKLAKSQLNEYKSKK